MSYQLVKYDVDGPVATLLVDRPRALNALNAGVLRELRLALEAFLADPMARVIVLGGAGDKAFIAGADIADMAELTPAQAEAFARDGQWVTRLLAEGNKVSVAAVQGFALGGGCEMAMACDIVVAGPHAKFGQPEVKLGVIPGFGGTQRLARIVGAQRAKYLALTGRMLNAEQAYAWGLVSLVTSADQSPFDVAIALAKEIASVGWDAVQAGKRSIDEGLKASLLDGLDREAREFGKLFATEDQREGMRAFLEKRAPEFVGR